MHNTRTLVFIASLLLMTAVAAGAFGAHALKALVPASRLEIWQTAVLYQLVHGLGLLVLASLANRLQSSLLGVSAGFMLAGTLLFSGSLYLLTLSGHQWLGPVTPLGGACLIVSWALLALAAWRSA